MAMYIDRAAYMEWLKGKKQDAIEQHLCNPAADTRAVAALTNVAPPLSFPALIGGKTVEFRSAAAKFRALADAWEKHNSGRSVRDYYHISLMQIIGMSKLAIPWMLERLKRGESEWIFAMKCVTGIQADTPAMLGDADRIVRAWIEWGEEHERRETGRRSRTDEELDSTVVPETQAG